MKRVPRYVVQATKSSVNVREAIEYKYAFAIEGSERFAVKQIKLLSHASPKNYKLGDDGRTKLSKQIRVLQIHWEEGVECTQQLVVYHLS
jgi:hypothetical protein